MVLDHLQNYDNKYHEYHLPIPVDQSCLACPLTLTSVVWAMNVCTTAENVLVCECIITDTLWIGLPGGSTVDPSVIGHFCVPKSFILGLHTGTTLLYKPQ